MPGWMRRETGGEWIHVCMAESQHCSSETTTTLLIGYMSIQNEKLKKKNPVGKSLQIASSLTTNCNDPRGEILSSPGTGESQGGNTNRCGGAGWLEG